MVAKATDDAWMEECLIAISKIDGSDLSFHGVTKGITIDFGEKDIEGIPLVNGGRITSWKPEGDSSITFEGITLQAGTDTGIVGNGFFDLLHSVDSSVPIRITNSRNRDKYRILIMWTNDPTPTTAEVITADTFSAYRIGMVDGHFTSVKEDFTDGILKVSATFKCTAYDKSGSGNVMEESCAGSSASDILPQIASYTAANKFG